MNLAPQPKNIVDSFPKLNAIQHILQNKTNFVATLAAMDLILFRKNTINLQIDNEYFQESKKSLYTLLSE